MEEKKQIKIKLRTAIIIFIVLVCIFIGAYLLITKKWDKLLYINYNSIKANTKDISDESIAQFIDVDIDEFKSFKDFFIGSYITIEENSEQTEFKYSGVVDNSKKIEFKEQAQKNFKLLETYILNSDYNLAQEILEGINTSNKGIYDPNITLKKSNVSQDFLNKIYAYTCSGLIKNHFKFRKYNINIVNNDVDFAMTINDKYYIVLEYNPSECYFYILDGTEPAYNQDPFLFDHIQGYDSLEFWYQYQNMGSLDKPIIYLYPTKDTEVSVKLLKADNITCSYPKYKDGWKVLAHPSGILKDLDTNRQLYSLYYESNSDMYYKVEKEGFVVKDEDTISFLEEKLAILGLTEREAEEFIVYWLPKLEANKYNYIRFATIDEINESIPLEISPNPDTTIRILMTFKGLEKHINVQEQHLETPNRTGFVTVEWGGTEIK